MSTNTQRVSVSSTVIKELIWMHLFEEGYKIDGPDSVTLKVTRYGTFSAVAIVTGKEDLK